MPSNVWTLTGIKLKTALETQERAIMEKEVIISIHGVQTDPDGSDEVVDFVTKGSLGGSLEQGYYLTYMESELTGLEGTTTTFQIGQDQITMLRKGNLNSSMVFKEGERHVSLYDAGFGGFMLGVNTHKVRADIGNSGGDMELRYAIEVENTVIGENAFHIQVRDPAVSSARQKERDDSGSALYSGGL